MLASAKLASPSQQAAGRELRAASRFCSVAEVLFFDTKVGSVVGPFRGSDAYYIAKVVDRRPATVTLSLADKNQRDLVERDYVRRRFLAWARGIAARTAVR